MKLLEVVETMQVEDDAAVVGFTFVKDVDRVGRIGFARVDRVRCIVADAQSEILDEFLPDGEVGRLHPNVGEVSGLSDRLIHLTVPAQTQLVFAMSDSS